MRAAEEERAKLGPQAASAPMVAAAPVPTIPKGDDVLAMAPPEKLAALVEKALKAADVILSLQLDPHSPDFIKLVSLQQSTLASVLATQARTDPGRLRGQQGDKIGELLAKIRAAA